MNKELAEAFEKTTTQNVKTCIEYTKETRVIVRELEDKIEKLQKQIIQQNETIQGLNSRMAIIQNDLRIIK